MNNSSSNYWVIQPLAPDENWPYKGLFTSQWLVIRTLVGGGGEVVTEKIVAYQWQSRILYFTVNEQGEIFVGF